MNTKLHDLKTNIEIGEQIFEEDIKTTLLLFSRNKNLKTDLARSREILYHQQIDDILWYDWDPIRN